MDRQAHFEQVIAQARARPNLTVHDSAAPLDAQGQVVHGQYVVLHDVGPDAVHLRFSERKSIGSAYTMRVVGRCVGVDPGAARRMADVFGKQMEDHVITVAGRICQPIVIDEESDVTPDKTVSPPLWHVDVDLTYRSEPAG